VLIALSYSFLSGTSSAVPSAFPAWRCCCGLWRHLRSLLALLDAVRLAGAAGQLRLLTWAGPGRWGSSEVWLPGPTTRSAGAFWSSPLLERHVADGLLLFFDGGGAGDHRLGCASGACM